MNTVTMTQRAIAAAAPLSPPAADRATQWLCAWAGPVAVILSLLGMVVVGGYVPATDPAADADAIARFYIENLTHIRIGMLLSMLGFTLFVPFGVAIALQTRRIESVPVMTYVQIAAVAIAALEGVLSTCIWLTASFRPGEIPAEFTRTLHDLGWIVFLVDVPPFSVWMAAIGIAILRDRDVRPLFPRWIGYFNLWVALLILPALLLPFFKSGPFAYNGVLALYLPFGAFFTWMVVMTPGLLRAISRP